MEHLLAIINNNLQNTFRVSVLQKTTLCVLRVLPKAIAGAFKSFYLLLTPNTDTHSVIFMEKKGELCKQ